jgi:hypothetical protein
MEGLRFPEEIASVPIDFGGEFSSSTHILSTADGKAELYETWRCGESACLKGE